MLRPSRHSQVKVTSQSHKSKSHVKVTSQSQSQMLCVINVYVSKIVNVRWTDVDYYTAINMGTMRLRLTHVCSSCPWCASCDERCARYRFNVVPYLTKCSTPRCGRTSGGLAYDVRIVGVLLLHVGVLLHVVVLLYVAVLLLHVWYIGGDLEL